MNEAEINSIIKNTAIPDPGKHPKLVETHISWVIIGSKFVFKIKKPMHYSFLDFSTLKKRKFYCERELKLNSRLTDIYLKVLPVTNAGDKISIGKSKGKTIDYALMMHKMQPRLQMDRMLKKGTVRMEQIKSLAEEISAFHYKAEVVDKPFDLKREQENFNDLATIETFVTKNIGTKESRIIEKAIRTSTGFLKKNKKLFEERNRDGFIRDCHGDLHSKNIFLYKKPVVFDCIEFNDDFRQIDLLNEIAFFCMDLEDYGKDKLSVAFQKFYNRLFPCMQNEQEKSLFIYYKLYRANVRAKVNALKAMQASEPAEQILKIKECRNYLALMKRYLGEL